MNLLQDGGAFLLFAMVMTGTPGPNNAMATVSGARIGLRRTLPLVVGMAAGFALMFVAMAIGLDALLQNSSWLRPFLRIASIVCVTWIAWKLLNAGILDADDDRPLLGWVGGAAFQWINPKAWIMTGSAATLYLPPTPGAWDIGFRAVMLFVTGFVLVSTWGAFGSLLRGLLESPAFARSFNAAMAFLLLASTLPILLGE